jgi:hypothetical protein
MAQSLAQALRIALAGLSFLAYLFHGPQNLLQPRLFRLWRSGHSLGHRPLAQLDRSLQAL